jgi:23S rRNA (cytosine1962-C5)-methyltransferase
MPLKLASFFLKAGKEQSLKRFHPWVFSGAIDKADGKPQEGDLVNVFASNGEFLGLGHCQIGSIAIRILSFEPVEANVEFWKSKINKAWNLRKALNLTDNMETNVFRLVHAEGDGLPGLVIDFYNGTAVIQTHTVGMFLVREMIVEALKEVLGNKLKAVYEKSEKSLPYKSEVSSENGSLFGEDDKTEVSEHGLRFRVDWVFGQKTGFFIDQRENRRLVQQFAKNCDVLNMFCYTGGFSFYAMKGGARSVHSVDSSAKAIELTNQNVELNFADDKRHKAIAADAFEFMRDIKDKYDLIILDPPAFAKHRGAVSQALQAYKRINTRAFEQIRSGGIVFTFSCSQVVSKEKFREAVFSAAAISGRNVRILHQLTQPADHPVSIYHPEGEYLKGLVLYVE